MQIKEIRFLHEIQDLYNDSIDIGVIFKDGSSYTIIVRTPKDFDEEMLQEKTNFVQPDTPSIVVKKLTKEIITEAIEAYAQDDGYWLKLCQFGDQIDIDVLNKLDLK